MPNIDPERPEDAESQPAREPKPTNPDYFTDPSAMDAAFKEIVSELSDLSTNPANTETARTENKQPRALFPRAPWVPKEHWAPTESPNQAPLSGPAGYMSGPRDWSSDATAAQEEFEQPNPEFLLSADPARNLGWFLTSFSLLSVLITMIFVGADARLAYGILGVLFLAGISLLIWRMPADRDLDSGNGAQV